jgi:plasmid maintenance system killer protein
VITSLVEIFFASRELAELYECETRAEDYPPDIIDSFFYHLSTVVAAESEADLLMLLSLPLETHGSQYLLRLGNGWKLSLLIRMTAHSQVVEVDLIYVLERSAL